MTKNIKLSTLIRDQLPEHVRNNYDTFVKFLEAYYEWMEQSSNPVDVIRNWEDYMSVNSSIDEFVDEIKNEIFASIPNQVLADKHRLARHAREFLRVKGTAKSYEFLFRVLFNEDIELYYPKENIFRLSDGTWHPGDKVLVTSSNIDPSTIIYKKITQTRVISEFVTEEASAVVIKAQRYFKNQIYQTIFYLDDLKGEFKDNYPLNIVGETETETIYPIVTSIGITSGGTGYTIGDRIVVGDGSSYWSITDTIPDSKIVDTGITTIIPAAELLVTVNGIPTTDFTYDGRYLNLANHAAGSTVVVALPSSSGYIVVSSVDGTGAITDVKFYEFPVGYQSQPPYSIVTNSGSGANLDIVIGTTGTVPGYYADDKGRLSSTNYLIDSYYYQEYSYVIRASISIDSYGEVVKKLLHPSGTMMFGEIRIYSIIDMFLRGVVTELTQEYRVIETLVLLGGDLHARTSDIDAHKLTFDNISVRDYGHLVLGDITTYYDKRWNFGIPSMITSVIV